MILIIAGTTISTVGYGITGFNYRKIEEGNNRLWYQTVHINDDGVWYGFNSHIFNIGYHE